MKTYEKKRAAKAKKAKRVLNLLTRKFGVTDAQLSFGYFRKALRGDVSPYSDAGWAVTWKAKTKKELRDDAFADSFL